MTTHENLKTAREVVRLTYSCVYTGDDGETRFKDVAVSMTPQVYVAGIPLVDVAKPEPVTALTFSRLEPGYSSDWHPAPRRQFAFIAAGTAELTVTDGETRAFGPGSVLLVQDTIGKGHQTRAVGPGECVFITVAVSDLSPK
jgi:quercetin dioxygenase-like cupin family protein